MTDHESQLRDLLHSAVPDDASSLDPQTVSAAARQARHRSRLVTLGAAAATVAVIGAAAVVATQGSDDDRAADDTKTTAPYNAPACPATLPELSDANTTTGDLTGLVSVRLCPDLDVPAGVLIDPMSADEQRAVRAGMDALVFDIDRFRTEIAALPEGIKELCASMSVMNNRQSLQFTVGDRTVLVPTPTCGEVNVEGRQVDGGALAQAFLVALDRQRDELGYRRDYAGPLSCSGPSASSPARPGREHLVAAVRCNASGTSTALDDTQLAELETAWRNPGKVPDDPTAVDDESACTAVEDPSFLVVGTDHGDLLRLTDSPCGYLYWSGSIPNQQAALPTTLKELGFN